MKQQMIAHSNTTPHSEILQGNLITSCQTTIATLIKLHQQQVAHLHLLLLLQDLELMDWHLHQLFQYQTQLQQAPATQIVATNVPSVNNSESQGTNTAEDTSGALNSQSFVERMNSAANLIVTKKRTNLADELIDR